MFALDDDIVAVATPKGRGGIGIVRVSGDNAEGIGRALFQPAQPKLFTPRRLSLGRVVEPGTGDCVDQVLAVLMKGPATYTGQDVFEFQAHGGPLVVERIVELCLEKGARTAGPGEFTMRAFLAGKIDLSQAEAVLALVEAKTRAASRLAARQLEGGLTSSLAGIRSALAEIMARLEVGVDFPDEGIEETPYPELSRELAERALAPLNGLLAQATRARCLRKGARVVLSGPVNVGKSSLFNKLLDKERALVFPQPGTTRDYLEADLELEELPVVLVDTAGTRAETPSLAAPVEAAGIALADRMRSTADLILQVAAADSEPIPPRPEEPGLDPAQKIILVVNRIDLVGEDRIEKFRRLNPYPVMVLTSAKTGQGVVELKSAIRRCLAPEGSLTRGLTWLPNLRQEECLKRAMKGLEGAARGLSAGLPPEVILVDLRSGLDGLGELTGESVGEAVLETIFSRFCIGK